MKNNKGYTLIEILIVMAIGVVILSFIIDSFYNLIKTQALDRDYDSIASLVDQAKSLSINSKSASKYGLFFSSSTVAIFKGDTYSTSTVYQSYSLNSKVNISAINLVGSSTNQVIFNRLNGYANASGTIAISLKSDPAVVKTIQIYKTGAVEYK